AAFIPDDTTRRFLLKNVAGDGHGTFRWKPNLRDIRASYARLIEAIPGASGKQFDKPALFLRGGKSDYVSDADWPGIKHLYPNAKLATLCEAGHWLHADCPDQFVANVLEFLS
ncbi:MAG TPA: alpha/beta hydrolase, partial [Verrucomicrobiota bacterium]|nr:alpha/beta hydrolase [Verrucomicrobiota bacterium]